MTLRRAAAVGALIGLTGWLIIWFQTEPRANWDSLIYHTHAFQYAGQSPAAADAQSWQVYARYADDTPRGVIQEALAGRDWRAPERDRWMNLYRMRPIYPLLVAAAYPVLGLRAPMAVSALVTIGFVVVSFAGFGLLFGHRVAALATAVALVNMAFTQWLVLLATDGLALVWWAAVLVSVARYAQTGSRPWLAAIGFTVLALALTRPTGSLAPLVPGLCALAAAAARHPVWRRFTAATLAAAVPAILIVIVLSALRMPGISDVLQENPTRHFALPDVANPVAHLFTQIRWAVPYRLLPTLLAEPVLLAAVIAGFAGLWVSRSWIVAPFLVAALVVPVAWLIHPIWSDAARILSPAWVSLNLGLALLVNAGFIANRNRIRDAVDRLTTSPAAP